MQVSHLHSNNSASWRTDASIKCIPLESEARRQSGTGHCVRDRVRAQRFATATWPTSKPAGQGRAGALVAVMGGPSLGAP